MGSFSSGPIIRVTMAVMYALIGLLAFFLFHYVRIVQATQCI